MEAQSKTIDRMGHGGTVPGAKMIKTSTSNRARTPILDSSKTLLGRVDNDEGRDDDVESEAVTTIANSYEWDVRGGDPNEDLYFLESLCSPCGRQVSTLKIDSVKNHDDGVVDDPNDHYSDCSTRGFDGATEREGQTRSISPQPSQESSHSLEDGADLTVDVSHEEVTECSSADVISAPSRDRTVDVNHEEVSERSFRWASPFIWSGTVQEVDSNAYEDERDLRNLDSADYSGTTVCSRSTINDAGTRSTIHDADRSAGTFDSTDDEIYDELNWDVNDGYDDDLSSFSDLRSISDNENKDDISIDEDSEVISEDDFPSRK